MWREAKYDRVSILCVRAFGTSLVRRPTGWDFWHLEGCDLCRSAFCNFCRAAGYDFRNGKCSPPIWRELYPAGAMKIEPAQWRSCRRRRIEDVAHDLENLQRAGTGTAAVLGQKPPGTETGARGFGEIGACQGKEVAARVAQKLQPILSRKLVPSVCHKLRKLNAKVASGWVGNIAAESVGRIAATRWFRIVKYVANEKCFHEARNIDCPGRLEISQDS
uniref:Uncharacterized protein n=1 Tax=Ascaris lumbricoides TaxID=6252 RepID=A0A0M3HYX6_ASCLU